MDAASHQAPDSEPILADVELAGKCARGDESAFRRVFEAYEPSVRRLLLRILGNLEDAEELTAETFLRFWRSAGRFRGDCSLRAFLARIALNLARDRMRQTLHSPLRLSDSSWSDSLNYVQVTEHYGEQFEGLIDAIRSGFRRLSPDEREVLTLYYLNDWDYADICQALGVSYDVLRTRLVRARKRLREIVGSVNEE